jgi:formylglycine-generating enzyme required for sulfatase activity
MALFKINFKGSNILRVGATPPDLAKALGIKMKKLRPGKFYFQGAKDVTFDGCKIAKVEFTNGMFRKLLELEPDKLTRIVKDPQDRLEYSLSVVHPDHKNESKNCPMVGLDYFESEGIAGLLGKRLPTELEWERAAAHIDGRWFPWGDEIEEDRLTFETWGTRSVYLNWHGASQKGVLDLLGNVSEWTSTPCGEDRVLRGGSWHDHYFVNVINNRHRFYSHPGQRDSGIGFRVAEDLK